MNERSSNRLPNIREQSPLAFTLAPLVIPAWFLYNIIWYSIGAIEVTRNIASKLESQINSIEAGKRIINQSLHYLPSLLD